MGMLRSSVGRGEFCLEQIAKVRRDLEIVEPLIGAAATSLTEIGQAIARPLLETINERCYKASA
jgi:hypothetical protein